MKILVTGGAGFIGSHIVDALVSGHEVTVVDDLSYGHRQQVNPQARFVELSITNPEIDGVFAKGEFDLVLHFAAQKGVRPSFEDPVLDAQLNVIGLLRVLEGAAAHGVKSVVHASTGGTIYGEAQQVPTPESAAIDPQSPYTITKRAGELYMRYYTKRHGIKGITLRLANIFGPRQDPAGEACVVSIFIERVLAGEPMIVYGDGAQTRDYLYVDDLVAAYMAVIARIGSLAPGEYNVGTGEETTVNDVVSAVRAASGELCEVKHEAAIAGELRRSAIDSSAFMKACAWTPEVRFSDGVRKTWKWFASGGFGS